LNSIHDLYLCKFEGDKLIPPKGENSQRGIIWY